jgi:arylsulfatase A-like enzyme/Tfp pilus assembly protein PilF
MVFSAEHSSANRRGKWLAVFVLIVLVVTGAIYWRWHAPPRPNIILVTFDTTRADRLGAYGYELGLTDAFDEFAKRGVMFEKAYAPGPITLPSHATMLTGLYPPEHDLRVNGSGKLSHDIPFLPEILKQHGYDTGAFIAAPVLDSRYGLDRGFDVYDDEFASSGEIHGEPRRDGKVIVDSALRWLQQRTDKPFFCWIHLYDAHGPYDPRVDAYQQRFESNPYDAGVAWEVQQFGRITEHLEDQNLRNKTLVVVAGDHGEGLDDHQEDEHGMLVYNTTLHVPFVFVGPEQHCHPGTRVSPAVSLADLMPTLLDILRIPVPKHVSGRSLLAALKGQSIDARDCYAEAESPFVLNGWSPLQTVISGRWKYIQSTRPELYDLENDSGELSDLAETSSEECQRLQGRLNALQNTFQVAHAGKVNLSERDLQNLRTLGYVGGVKKESNRDSLRSSNLPDVKDFLPWLAKYEKAKHLVLESRDTQSAIRMDEAIALLQEVVQATADFPMADALLGDCLAQKGEQAEAEQIWRALLLRRPDFFKVRFNLGKLLNEQGRFEEAAAEFRKYLYENPDSSTAHFELAQALTQLSEFEQAIKDYREAIRIAPEFTMASLQLGRLLLQLNQPAVAQSVFETALAHDPRSVDLRAHLMMVLAQTGQNSRAIQQGMELVALDSNSFDTRFNLALLLIAQRQFADGLAQLLEAKKLRPDDPRLLPQIQRAEAALKLSEK